MRYTGKELLKMWQESGLSQRQLAKELGMNFNILHGRIYRAQNSEDKLSSNDERIEMEASGNTKEYTSKGTRIKTLEQLITECKINTDKWAIDRHVINKWEVGAKLDDGTIVVEPLFQVKAWLVNRSPEPVEPVISAVDVKIKPVPLPKAFDSPDGRVLVLADLHFGFLKNVHDGKLISFHDRKALAATLAMVKAIDPDLVVIVGDILDLAEWSDKFIRSPDMYNTTQPAVVEAAWFLGQLRRLVGNKEIILLEGNHEERVSRAINKQIPYAYGLSSPDGLPVLSVPHILGLKQMAIHYIGGYPKSEFYIGNNLRAIHGEVVRAKSGATAGAILEDAQASTIFGHVHRSEFASRTVFDRDGSKTITAFSPGCLCKIDGTVPAAKSQMNWQQGIGVVDFSERFVAPVAIPIDNGSAMFGGKVYTGQDYLEQLRADTGFAF